MEARSILQYWMLLRKSLDQLGFRGQAKIVHVTDKHIRKGIRTNDGNPIALAVQDAFPYLESVSFEHGQLRFHYDELYYSLQLDIALMNWTRLWYEHSRVVDPVFFGLVIPNSESRGHAYVIPD
jgi:hypothetical protein